MEGKRPHAIYCGRPCKNAAAQTRRPDEKARNTARYAGEAEHRRAYAVAAYWESPEKAREYSRRYRREHPNVRAAQSQLRRARKMATSVEPVTVSDFTAIGDRLDWRCAYCGVAPIEHWDHVVPLSRGGAHSVENLTGACSECNLSKGSKLLHTEWSPVRPR